MQRVTLAVLICGLCLVPALAGSSSAQDASAEVDDCSAELPQPIDRDEFKRAIDDYDRKPRTVLMRRAKRDYENGEFEEALAEYSAAIELAPTEAEGYVGRGDCYLAKRDYDKAITDFAKAIDINPKDSYSHVGRGFAWSAKKAYASAVSDFTRAIELDRGDSEAYESLAWIRATCPDAQYRSGAKAVELATRACSLAEWSEAECFDTLAAAYAESGQFSEAVSWQRKTLMMPGAYKDDESLQRARKRLELYEHREPYQTGGHYYPGTITGLSRTAARN